MYSLYVFTHSHTHLRRIAASRASGVGDGRAAATVHHRVQHRRREDWRRDVIGARGSARARHDQAARARRRAERRQHVRRLLAGATTLSTLNSAVLKTQCFGLCVMHL